MQATRGSLPAQPRSHSTLMTAPQMRPPLQNPPRLDEQAGWALEAAMGSRMALQGRQAALPPRMPFLCWTPKAAMFISQMHETKHLGVVNAVQPILQRFLLQFPHSLFTLSGGDFHTYFHTSRGNGGLWHTLQKCLSLKRKLSRAPGNRDGASAATSVLLLVRGLQGPGGVPSSSILWQACGAWNWTLLSTASPPRLLGRDRDG